VSEPITLLEVTLSRVITEDGHMAVKVKTPCHYNAVELLGLLETAKMQIFRDMGEL
jgi:hypothetical protein